MWLVRKLARRDDSDNEVAHSNNTNEKRKKKRKRKQVSDLRFETTQELGSISKRKERKKKYFEEKKKKKKAETKDVLDFPGRESIKFGEVVEAPPKLAVILKAFKSAQNASQERLRLKAIEAYRNRKGWSSRPGLHLPPPVTTSP
ncbi:hypothetical protein HS088_TW08G00933 [Tripterygium wilfordii]|uniref:Uncharacterized protein n=1 Tax=Tripterygium wilfordii TaxID=458696 RepID=A0A7J7DD90_TRIWF|nr:uncharacterized protein LOC120003659 [Tripterygium wilfordii]KAF5744330.1 hypothetical protein HS088_TW08G00933 [Tripterygium wilfordii]